MKKTIVFALFFTVSLIRAQVLPQVSFTNKFSVDGDCHKGLTMTAHHDENGKPFLYIAAKAFGLEICNDSGKVVKTILVKELNNLDVNNMSQSGNYLFLALGNIFNDKMPSGFAIIDVSAPAQATVVSKWSDNAFRSGAGAVIADENYLYLGAMHNGVLIFDISDKKKPVKVSAFVPDIHFPDPKPDPRKYNARGLALRGNYLYVCYDAGQFRILDVSDKKNPKEIGRYTNPVMNGKPHACNNVALDSNYAYVAMDYCGLEVLDISDPKNIRQVSWLSPWGCEKGGMSWFSAGGYANEIVLDKKNKLLFISAGRTPLIVVSIADPLKPQIAATYGTGQEKGSWGVSVYGNRIFLAYICAFVPFKSTWSGVEVLEYNVK